MFGYQLSDGFVFMLSPRSPFRHFGMREATQFGHFEVSVIIRA
jgi:hypothetical protein